MLCIVYAPSLLIEAESQVDSSRSCCLATELFEKYNPKEAWRYEVTIILNWLGNSKEEAVPVQTELADLD